MILEVDIRRAQDGGLVIMRAGKTVFLVDQVPAEYLSRHELAASPPTDSPP